MQEYLTWLRRKVGCQRLRLCRMVCGGGLPRRKLNSWIRGSAAVRPLAQQFQGASPNEGQSPGDYPIANGGASRRLTTSRQAVEKSYLTFEAKPPDLDSPTRSEPLKPFSLLSSTGFHRAKAG